MPSVVIRQERGTALTLQIKSNADGNQSLRFWRANNLLNKFEGFPVKVCNYEVFMMF